MGWRILFVEDEESTHFCLGEYFRQRGHLVDGARSSEEALQRLESTSYPVVIVDLRLSEAGRPDRAPEGLALVERIRREHPGTRVLVLTACGAEFEAEARRRGADCFLQKPQPLSHIAEIVETLCGRGAGNEEGEGSARRPGSHGERRGARKKILLVDDSSTVLTMERALLSRSYELITARDGREGVEKAIAEKPDLILMDVVMPLLGGIEAVKRIRTEPETRDIPVIMVSTRGELTCVESSYQSGCDDYVTKPFNGAELLAKVKGCLGD